MFFSFQRSTMFSKASSLLQTVDTFRMQLECMEALFVALQNATKVLLLKVCQTAALFYCSLHLQADKTRRHWHSRLYFKQGFNNTILQS